MTLEVVLCMGSSCFSRGNAANLEAVRRHVAAAGATLQLELRGHLCEGRCSEGPHLLVDGRLYSGVTPGSVRSLLERHLAGPRP